MLIALLTALLLGGGQAYELIAKDVQKRVVEVVEDEDRARSIQVLMRTSSTRLEAEMDVVQGRVKAWTKADLDPATGRETYEELMRAVEDDRQRAQQYGFDALFAMKAQMSRAEWDELFNREPE